MQALRLEIYTKQNVLLQTQSPWVTVPGSQGELGILPDHAPLVTTLKSGVVRYKADDSTEQQAVVHHGYAQVRDNIVTVLVEVGEKSEAIDRERARAASQRAVEKLKTLARKKQLNQNEMKKWESKLVRSLQRMSASA